MSVNKAILIGRLGKDPELKYTPSGRAVCTFSLATSERWTGQDGQKNDATTWHNIVAWAKQAEIMKEYLHKGKEVYIEGRISNRSYEKKDGTRGYISEVVVQNFQFLGSKSENHEAAPQAPEAAAPVPETGGDDDDLPF